MGARLHRPRWRRVLAWTGAAVGTLAIVLGGLAWWYLWAPTPEEPDLPAAVTDGSLTVDGRERHYVSVVPEDLPDGAPLWVVLHGSNNTLDQIRAFTGYRLEELAEQDGFAVVYAQGYEKTWHDCRTGTPYSARRDGVDDVHFIEELVASVTAEHSLDASRVYGLGYSNGSHMLFRMAAESPGTFAGIVANAANLPAASNTGCAPFTTPVPVVLVEGTGDPINPYDGGQAGAFGQSLGEVLPAEESARVLADVNGVAGEPTTGLVGGEAGERGSVTLTEYGAGTPFPVRLYTVEGGGHAVPVPGVRMPRVMGGSTTHLDAPAVAVELFAGLPGGAG